uniref:Protein kinase domain-containing protein n=1 Tax=Anopheles epiroticus TaxID=199890 RepID=A0A182P4V3_9DIPT
MKQENSQKFSAGGDYRQTLNRLKTEFERRYNDQKQASIASLTEYELLRTLGSGAFGTVIMVQPPGETDIILELWNFQADGTSES